MAGRRILPLNYSEQISLGTLGAGQALAQDFDDNVNDRMYAVSADVIVSMEGHTAGEGPLVCILAHSDYTGTEVLEWYQATQAWDLGDMIAQEQRRRKCRLIGVLPGDQENEVLNDGEPVRVPLKFYLESGKTLAQVLINNDGSALTTGTVVHYDGKIWARRA